MGKIYYMMGKSSSGKDTLYGMLMKDEKLRLKTVVPYTTRPMRAGEENEKAGQAHGSEPVPRLVERSNIIIAVAAMLLIIIVLILGNQSTL